MNPERVMIFHMKLGLVTKLDKKKMAKSKKLTMILCQQIVMSLSLLQFVVNLDQF